MPTVLPRLAGLVLAGAAALPAVETFIHGRLSPSEQDYLERLNRARRDPPAEAVRLAVEPPPDIASVIDDYFQIDRDDLQAELNALPIAPPLAAIPALTEAAFSHASDLFETARQSHQGSDGSDPEARAVDQGYSDYERLRENVYSYSTRTAYGHAAFLIDWSAETEDGMAVGRPHRQTLMDPAASECGIGVINGHNQVDGRQVGPQLVVQVVARRAAAPAYLVGIAYSDLDDDGAYSPGEERRGALIDAPGSGWQTSTASGGGYCLPLTGDTPGQDWVVRWRDAGGNHLATAIVPATGGINVRFELVDGAVVGGVEVAHACHFVARIAAFGLDRRLSGSEYLSWNHLLVATTPPPSAVSLARTFYLGAETEGRGLDDEAFARALGEGLFGGVNARTITDWAAALAAGQPRSELVLDAAHGPELAQVLAPYGIDQATATEQARFAIRGLVRRVYLQALRRWGSDDELTRQVEHLAAGSGTAAGFLIDVFASAEAQADLLDADDTSIASRILGAVLAIDQPTASQLAPLEAELAAVARLGVAPATIAPDLVGRVAYDEGWIPRDEGQESLREEATRLGIRFADGDLGNDLAVRGFVDQVFRGLLGRPASDNDRDRWSEALRQGGRACADLAHSLATSAEGQARVPASDPGFDSVFVDTCHQALFARPATPEEREAGIASLRSGTSRGRYLDHLLASAAFASVADALGLVVFRPPG